MTHLATLARGRSYRFSYAPSPLVLERGVAVPVNQTEFDVLRQQHERVTYIDGAKTMVRFLPTWSFTAMDGEPVEVEAPADEQVVRQDG